MCIDGSDGNDCKSCPTNPDPDSSYCDYGEVCSSAGECIRHSLFNSLCQSCTNSSLMSCPAGMLCLLDNAEQGASYCTALCETDLDCPNGYGGCGGIQMVPNGGTCTNDNDCSGDRRCLGSAEGVLSYCSCLTNSDCPQDVCLAGRCMNLGNACSSNADCSVQCTMIERRDGTQIGTCETKAKACGKSEGMTCTELKTGDAPCDQF